MTTWGYKQKREECEARFFTCVDRFTAGEVTWEQLLDNIDEVIEDAKIE